MRIRFIGSGEPDENAVCDVFGLSFPVGEWVSLAEVPAKLLTNPAFEVAPISPPDLDGDGYPGGSLSKATIIAKLDEAGVEYDGRWSRDRLFTLLSDD